jgi:hypothetical protein
MGFLFVRPPGNLYDPHPANDTLHLAEQVGLLYHSEQLRRRHDGKLRGGAQLNLAHCRRSLGQPTLGSHGDYKWQLTLCRLEHSQPLMGFGHRFLRSKELDPPMRNSSYDPCQLQPCRISQPKFCL